MYWMPYSRAMLPLPVAPLVRQVITVGIEIHVNAHGPVADGLAPGIIQRYSQHVENVIGDKAVTDIRAYLPEQYMYLGHHGGSPEFNPVPSDAGHLQASIRSDRASPDMVLVTDSNVLYGPWIEGVSSLNQVVWPHRRNPPPRRFPGYFAFRLIAQKLNGEAQGIALEALPPYLAELNA
jgi:hypothetical protein